MKKFKRFIKKITNPIRLVFKELKLIEWLSIKKTLYSTLLVLVISLFVGIIIVIFDTTLFKLRNVIIEL